MPELLVDYLIIQFGNEEIHIKNEYDYKNEKWYKDMLFIKCRNSEALFTINYTDMFNEFLNFFRKRKDIFGICFKYQDMDTTIRIVKSLTKKKINMCLINDIKFYECEGLGHILLLKLAFDN